MCLFGYHFRSPPFGRCLAKLSVLCCVCLCVCVALHCTVYCVLCMNLYMLYVLPKPFIVIHIRSSLCDRRDDRRAAAPNDDWLGRLPDPNVVTFKFREIGVVVCRSPQIYLAARVDSVWEGRLVSKHQQLWAINYSAMHTAFLTLSMLRMIHFGYLVRWENQPALKVSNLL